MAKTLFHSSERSNFIVNLKPERLRQLSCRVCMLAMILLTGSMLLTELTQDVYGSLSDAISDGGTRGVLAYLVLILRSVSSMFAVGGVLALIFAFIALIKKQFDPKRAALPAALLCSILILGIFPPCCPSTPPLPSSAWRDGDGACWHCCSTGHSS